MMRKLSTSAGLVLMLLPCSGSGQNIVGLREPQREVFVAVRGLVPAGSRVSGIEFVSNDATLFPEVFLARDAVSGRLPSPGAAIRSSGPIQGRPGVTTVSFDPYETREAEYLWAAVCFPDDIPLRARGIGGGPGIGWRAERLLLEERSLFSVGGAMNEFSPGFDITFILGTAMILKTSEESPRNLAVGDLDLRAWSDRRPGVVTFELRLSTAAAVHLTLYTVAGQHVRSLANEWLPSGVYRFDWFGSDGRGRRVAGGVYCYRVTAGMARQTGKIRLVR